MSEYRRQILIGGVAAVIVGIIVVAGVVYLPLGTTTTSTPISTTRSTTISQSSPASATTTNASVGLSFALTLSSTQLVGGQPISITATVTNIRPAFNNVTMESDWSEIWFVGWGMIDSCNSFANAQVFQGYYTQANISSLQPGVELQLAKPIIISCPFIPGAWSTYFPFQPNESKVGYQYSTSGDYGSPNSSTTFHSFAPGVYTVAAGDEWGQMIILHFTVNGQTTSSSATISTATAQTVNGLRLDLSVAPSNGSVGTWVISANEYNTLSTMNNITLASNWAYPTPSSLNPFSPCGVLGAFGVGIFQGYYDVSNYTEANALAMYNSTIATPCTTTTSVPNEYYSFNPGSSNATLVFPGESVNIGNTLSLSFGTNGYWTGGFVTHSKSVFHSFSPGTYTVLAADEWGRVILVHIDVASNGSITSTSTSTTSTPAQSSTDLVCITTNYQVLGIESMTVQNGTTVTLPVRTTTTSTVEATLTTTTNVTESVSYVTATTSYSPPSSWTVVACTYVK